MAQDEGTELRFVADLTASKVGPSVARLMQSAIQKTVLEVLANVDLAGQVTIRIPDREWFGIWIEGDLGGFRDFSDLRGLR